MADLTARAKSGAIWTYASYTTGRAFVFVGITLVARLLRPEDYGLFNMAAVAINLLEGTYDLGLRRGLIYFGNGIRAWKFAQTGFVLALATGLLLTVTLFALGPLAAGFFGEPRVTGMMQVLSVYFGIACLGVVPDAILQHRLAFDRRFWPAIAAPATRYAIAVPLAALGFGAWSLVYGQLIGITLEVLLLLVLAEWRPQIGWSGVAAQRLLHYSSQVSLVEWTAAIGLNLDYVLVGHFQGSTVLGLYTLAFKLPDATIGAAGWVGSRVLLPLLVQVGEQQQNVGATFLVGVRLLVALLAPLAAGLCLLAPRIVPLLFGTQWSPAVPVVQLLAVSACLNGFLQVLGAAFMAAGQPRKITQAQVAWLVVLIPALYVAARANIVAVALAHVAATLVFLGVKVALVPSALGVRLVEIARAAVPGLLATCAIVFVLAPLTRLPAPAFLPFGVVMAIGALGVTWHMLVSWRRHSNPAAPSRQLRVTMVTQSFFPRIGGAETNLEALVEPLRAVGVDVQIVTRLFRGLPRSGSVAGVHVERIPAPGGQIQASLTFILCVVWFLLRSQSRPDVVHAHELRSPTLAAVCSGFILRRPVIAHVLRGGLLGDIRVLRTAPFGKARLWLIHHAVDRFVAVSRETRDELLALGVPDRRIAHISYGVDTRRFCPARPVERCALRKILHLEGCKVVLVVARLVPEKGFDRLLAAWPEVRARVPSALLVIVGDGPERARLEGYAAGANDVQFIGELRDPLPYLQAADCFTLPSLTEGQPISLLEAMSVGLVCVGSSIGGISDALADGRLGVLVPPGDVPGLACALVRVLQLPTASHVSLGAAAREEILEHHSIEANAAALRRLYEEIAA